jgi:putative ABC transport system substrate-binding protein
MRRRNFIAGLSGAAVWPLVARAQGQSVPVIGVVTPASNDQRLSAALRSRLNEIGYAEGQNIQIEYRWGATNFERQRELVADLVRQQPAVILAVGAGPALRAKDATLTIPIVFLGIGSVDPVKLSIVASINRPGGNVTGVAFDDPFGKRLELLSELVPPPTLIAYLSGGPRFISFQFERPGVVATANALGRQLIEVECPSRDELARSFESIAERRAGGIFVSAIPLFGDIADEIIASAARLNIPATYPGRTFVLRGGLMSYNYDLADSLGVAVGLVGEILKGRKPADLPVRNSTRYEFVINLKTARQLGLDIPLELLIAANELID